MKMILTSKTAKDLEAIILKGEYDADVMLADIDGFLRRKRVTTQEAEYLRDLVEEQMDKRLEENLKIANR